MVAFCYSNLDPLHKKFKACCSLILGFFHLKTEKHFELGTPKFPAFSFLNPSANTQALENLYFFIYGYKLYTGSLSADSAISLYLKSPLPFLNLTFH